MDETGNREFFRQLYAAEFDRKDKQDAGDNFLVAGISALSTVGLYMWDLVDAGAIQFSLPGIVVALCACIWGIGLDQGDPSDTPIETLRRTEKVRVFQLAITLSVAASFGPIWWCFQPTAAPFLSALFASLCGVFSGCTVFGLFSVGASVWPRFLAHLPSPKSYLDYLDNLEAFYGPPGTDEDVKIAQQAARNELAVSLYRQFGQAGGMIRESNLIKSKWQSRAKTSLVIAVMVLVTNSVPTYLIKSQRANRTWLGDVLNVLTNPKGVRDEAKRPKSTDHRRQTPAPEAAAAEDRDSSREPGPAH